MSVCNVGFCGTFRTWLDVRVKSVMRSIADIRPDQHGGLYRMGRRCSSPRRDRACWASLQGSELSGWRYGRMYPARYVNDRALGEILGLIF